MMDYSELKKNTVNAKNQLKDSPCVRFENVDGSGKRIMFVGNSITLHTVSHSIGWHNEWGMAASEKEKDYVHIAMNEVSKIAPDSQFCICQIAEWEREYKNGKSKHCLYESAREFNADIIIMRAIENCPNEDFEGKIFKNELDVLLSFLNKSQKAKIILTTGFWRHPGDLIIREYAKENNLPCIELGDLGQRDDMKAIGLFEHSGVANHPGDLGMKTIAERILKELRKII